MRRSLRGFVHIASRGPHNVFLELLSPSSIGHIPVAGTAVLLLCSICVQSIDGRTLYGLLCILCLDILLLVKHHVYQASWDTDSHGRYK